MSSLTSIVTHRAGNSIQVLLNRPKALNSLNGEMCQSIKSIVSGGSIGQYWRMSYHLISRMISLINVKTHRGSWLIHFQRSRWKVILCRLIFDKCAFEAFYFLNSRRTLGGDVKSVWQEIVSKSTDNLGSGQPGHIAADFFRVEYEMNYLLGNIFV